jgi:hypothetical protein
MDGVGVDDGPNQFCTLQCLAICKQVDYKTDEQWQTWIRDGMQKLLSSNGDRTSVTPPEFPICAMPSPLTGAGYHQSVPVNMANHSHPMVATVTPLQTSVNWEQDHGLDLGNGGALFDTLNFDWNPTGPEWLETGPKVSNWQKRLRLCLRH